MAKINLDTEPRFKALMKELGFKKSKGEFVRIHNEACLSLGFPYTSQKSVRYYYGSFSFLFCTEKYESYASKKLMVTDEVTK